MLRPLRFSLLSAVLLSWALSAAAAPTVEVLAVDRVGDGAAANPAADILSVTLERDGAAAFLRVSFLSLETAPRALFGGAAPALLSSVPLRVVAGDRVLLDTELTPAAARYAPPAAVADLRADDPDAVRIPVPAELLLGPTVFTVSTTAGESVSASYPADKAYAANCALVLHGNQGLGYSDVFHGRWDDEAGSGFDEALQVHEATGVPGNFHLSGPLQSAAEWAARSGDPQDFNAWLAAGAAAGWAGMVTSAYAQHIMPFVTNEMNDWAVQIETDMIAARYGYQPRVAWVPERVWLDPSSYPNQGVNDWIGDNWQNHGVWGVILDDDVHLSGHDNHRIHTATNGLRLVPRDRSFTGNIIGGNGQASLDILTGLAGSGVGEFRIAVFAEDWEAAAEMGGWASITPNAVETYDWFINKCQQESAWLSTWKLADALSSPNFVGDTFDPTPGTYFEIGGFDGYGGGNNGWYPHWAGWVPYVTGGDGNGNCAGGGGSCKDYGTLWSEAFNALMAAPDNHLSQAGWYVLMTNLYETAWHDGMGGPISGWEHNYSAHIKNALVYAEAAHWAAGEYATTTAAYFSDIDHDGFDEVVLHSDVLFAVFEAVGGRCVNLFVKDAGGADTAIGNDNAYWSGTSADYNDANHVGAFSDVGPDYQHDFYDLEILQGTGTTVTLRASHNEVTKDISLTQGDAFLDAVYRVGAADHWIKAGMSPSLVDLVWNAEMDRVWTMSQAYMGRHNPNTGLTVAWLLGSAGAAHQGEFAATLLRGDEVRANGTFGLRLFAGHTAAPDGTGEIAELTALAADLTDVYGPLATAADWYPSNGRLVLTFDQPAVPGSLDPTRVGLDQDGDGTPEWTLDAATVVSTSTPTTVLPLELTTADAAAMNLLDPALLRLHLAADAIADENAVPNTLQAGGDAPPVTLHGATLITIDGRFEAGEWEGYAVLADSSDSAWGGGNEIDRLTVSWDAGHLYLGIDGIVTSNSWLLYLDVDPGGPDGETDLSAVDAWERGAVFTAPGFAADFQYGCYQHQSIWDGGSFWEIASATSAVDRTAEIEHADDPAHVQGAAGGSELAIPWTVLYPGLGGGVPAGCSISVVASICWDPEPDGVLGGDSAPSNALASLPTIDTVWTVTVDGNGDGEPDPWDATAVAAAPRVLSVAAWPNPFNPSTTVRFDLPAGAAGRTVVDIVNPRGERVARLLDEELAPGRHAVVWRGTDAEGRAVAAGAYYCVVKSGDRRSVRPLTLVK
ncbi:MAG TPA: FlgD immunoglobulin-like domain containing protein [Candidatus Krumholzibacteria bacterium]|nr:FlgD immunoglobulin-like domain containing protein [Candidatus Krumholzibacteria bacterium]HRX52387.1 FlgD immunoglobulin-like domain containing protein [Candidatus Krumholzibacteria bacterium]